ncbi:MAG: contractile injection system tape measure protein, partial [Acidobacteriota bacterium]
MATEQQHRIRRQILELTTLDETVAERLRPELGRMKHQHLVALIDRCLTEVSSPGRLHRIERLEIDLGIIDLKEFEHQFADRLGVQLRRALAKPLRDGGHRDGGRRNSGRRDEPDATSRLEVLDHFVHTGRLPWWVDASTSTVIDQHVEHLVKHSARSFADWARRLPSSVLRRLILHLDDARLTTLHEVMRTDTTESHEHKRNIETLLQVSGAVPGASRERFRAAVWQAVLDTTGQRESVNATAFWHAVLTRVAMDLGTPFGTLIERLADALEVPNGKRSESVLARTIASLVRHTADKPGAPSPSELDEILELDEIRQILTWLARGEHSSQDTANSAPEVLWNGQQVEPIPFAETQESALGPHSFFFELLSSLGKALEHVSARQRQHWLGILEDLDHRLRIDGWARPETSKALTRLLREVVQQRLLPADETRQYLESLESSLPRLRREVRDLIRHLDE